MLLNVYILVSILGMGSLEPPRLSSCSHGPGGRMAPCSPSSSSQARAAGPPTWRSLTEQLDQASQWTLACLRLLAPDAGGRKRLRAALLLRCREVGATAYVPEVIWMPVSPSLSVPAGKEETGALVPSRSFSLLSPIYCQS